MLAAVVDQGGYAQAAAALHQSQSAVSYAVARLQEELALPLLAIEGRKAVLTPMAKRFCNALAALLRDMNTPGAAGAQSEAGLGGATDAGRGCGLSA